MSAAENMIDLPETSEEEMRRPCCASKESSHCRRPDDGRTAY